MALPTTSETREFYNFADNGNGTTARYVKVTGGLGTFLEGVQFDSLTASYPNSTTEIYSYKIGGISGIVQAVLTVVYTDATKSLVQSVVRT
jgi:hypothetical protein